MTVDFIIIALSICHLELQSQMTAAECEKTKGVTNFRVHVELAINRIKEFKILQNALPTNALPLVDDNIKVCGNMQYSSTIN